MRFLSVLAVLLGLAAVVPAQTIFNPGPLRDFDGREWCGLTLNHMTDSQIKRRFRTEKGAVVPEALKMVAEKGETTRVDALLDGRGDKAVMRAIRVEYLGRPPSLMQLTDDWDERPVEYWKKGRTENWHLEVFEQRGVIAVMLGPTLTSRIDCFLLMDPDRVPVVTRGFSETETRIERPRDPGEGRNQVVSYGFVNANFDPSGDRPDWMDRRYCGEIERAMEAEARRYRGKFLRAGAGSGSLTIRLTASGFRGESARFMLVAVLGAATPYGSLNLSSQVSREISGGHRARSVDLLDDALDELDRDIRGEIARFGPEEPDAERKRTIKALYQLASDS